MSLTTLHQLANSSLWKTARSEYFEAKLNELKDVTKPIKTDIELSAGEMLAAKIAAATTLEEVLNGIDRLADQTKEKKITNYN